MQLFKMIFRCLFVILSFAAVIRATDDDERIRNAGLTARTKFEGNQQNDSYADKPAFSAIRRNRREEAPVDIKKFRENALAEHNKYRTNHGVNPLKLSDELNDMAQKYAERLAETGQMEHSQAENVGENLFSKSSKTLVTAYEVVNAWYQEIKNYDFNNPESNANHFENIAHFTQVIWKSSTDVGFGYASKNYRTFIVANYKPAGNMKGSFGENVPKIQKKDSRGNSAYNTQVTVSLLFGCTLLVPFIRYI